MRSTIVICLAVTALFSGCAYEGVIVEKRFRPLPFPDSLGVDGMYNFQLRDRVGQVHSQMVTPDVFSRYEVGDYFNDLQPPPATSGKDFKPIRPAPVEMDQALYQPVRTTHIHHRAKNGVKTAKAHHGKKNGVKTAKAHNGKKNGVKTAKAHHRKTHRSKIAQTHRKRHRPARV